MYALGAERIGLEPRECVYVDDLPFNLTPAAELGMTTIHHVSADETIPELERLLGVALR
jgi:FMN phosphatase YigB (HAD superfamily)